MNQGKLEVVKQELARADIDSWGIQFSSVQSLSRIRLFATP